MNTRPPRFTRRGLLIAGSATIVGGSALLALDQVFKSDAPLADSYAAYRIGERFAATYPNPDELWRGNPPTTFAQWRPRLSKLIHEDFESNRLVQVDGWWLAETEVRLCVYLYTGSHA
jgi:hypothetical protein